MLTRLRLKNFKAWDERLWEGGVELAPITLLLGPNSAGKTSLMQLPLLLRQTFEGADPALDLNLGGLPGDIVDLGSYGSLIHGRDPARELGVGITVHEEPSAPIEHRATYRCEGSAPALQRLELASGARRFAATRQAQGAYLLEAPGGAASSGELGGPASHPERSLVFSAEAIAALGQAGAELRGLSLDLRRALGKIRYLGPLRDRAARSYARSGAAPGDVGTRGERAALALLASVEPRSGGGRASSALLEQVSGWLRRLGLADELRLEQQGDAGRYELIVARGKERTNLIDVGFGISQVLPLLVLAYAAPEGATILAEQPEIHLHPRAQVGLAELVVEVMKTRRVQFLVETHSEHLFRRLQSLIADEALSPADCRLYFVEQDEEGRADLTRLQIDAYGRVANWPQTFFGDVIGETERQTRRLLERMRREAKPGS